jgi:filamentous hemagglutinin
VVGALTGGVEGALGAGISAELAPQLNGLTANLPAGVKEAVSVAAAAGLGALTGNAGGIAASINEDANNRMLHPNEQKVIADLAQKDPSKEALLTEAACALVQCAAGVSENDPAYATLKAMQDRGAQLIDEQALLKQAGGEGSFTYSGWDATGDAVARYKVVNRGIGVVQAVAGAAGLVASDAACTTGVGCVFAAISGTTLTDYMDAGVRQAMTGDAATPYGEQVLQALGLSPQAAQIVYGSLGIVAGAAPAAVDALANKAANAAAGSASKAGEASGEIRSVSETATNSGSIGIDEARAGHIFRDSEGHISDTPANRQLLENVANDPSAILGTDKYGTTWAAKLNPDGTQTWVGIRGGNVSYGGINQTPKSFNPQTGLASPTKPGK